MNPKIEALYARIPKLECKQQCYAYCGPVSMSRSEARTLLKQEHLKAFPLLRNGLTCPFLDPYTNTCTVYSVRPLICRLWGTTKALACPHGCVPEHWLSDEEASELISESIRLGGGMSGFVEERHFRQILTVNNSCLTSKSCRLDWR